MYIEYGTKEYWENELNKAKIDKSVYLSALKNEINAETKDDYILDVIIEKLHNANTTINDATKKLADLNENKEN